MNCEAYKNLIFDLIEGELDPRNADEVNSHLIFCRHCETELDRLLEEKELYSHFLFEIEPPDDLPQKFRAKLEKTTPGGKPSAENSATLAARIKSFAESLSLKPVFALAAVLLAVSAAFLFFRNPVGESHRAASFAKTPTVETKQVIAQNLSPEKSFGKEISLFSNVKRETSALKIAKKSPKISAIKKQPPDILKNSTEKAVLKTKTAEKENGNLGEAELKFKELAAFKVETARQFEKIELLLRSFRNVEIDEKGNLFNIGYEKQQARKLLDKNAQLREQAAVYGNMFLAEMLDKYEPYLLDIANLENAPSTAQVAEIKERVKNQNAILSLQAINY